MIGGVLMTKPLNSLIIAVPEDRLEYESPPTDASAPKEFHLPSATSMFCVSPVVLRHHFKRNQFQQWRISALET